MLAMLQSRMELSAPCAGSGALVALPWHDNSNGANQQEDLAAAHAAACRRVVDLEGAVNSLEVDTMHWHSSRHTMQLRLGPAKMTAASST